MIRPSYTLKLAQTKLRSKRGVLITSIIVSSLLFSTLIATVIIFTGAEKSALEFVKKAGNDRYLVTVSPNIPYKEVDLTNPPSLDEVRAIKAYEKAYYNNLQDKYKALGLPYDKANEIPALTPAAWLSETLPQEQRVVINWSSPVIEEMRSKKFEDYTKTASNKLSDLKLIGAKYQASGYYIAERPSQLPSLPGLRLVQNGKENFGDTEIKTGDSSPYGYYVNAIHNGTYSFSDQQLLSRYLLRSDGESLKGVPVIVSAQEAVSLFGSEVGIGKEPASASEKLVWLKAIQTKLNGKTYQVCYRNTAEQKLLTKIQNDYAEINSKKSNPDYKKPALIYDYPTGPCGDILVKIDERTAAERQADREADDTQRKLGTYVAPSHRVITFQIVGIKYAQPYTDYTKSIDGYVKSLLVPQDDSSSLTIPIQMYESLPAELKIDDIRQANETRTLVYAGVDDELSSHVLEFNDADKARSFINNETCPSSVTDCGKKFFASPYGSNYLILNEIGKLFSRIASIAFPAVLCLAAIIIWFTISRIMAENRKETAVYRAMGAKRQDVTSIYLVYVLLVGLRVSVISIAIGITAAFIVNYFYGKTLTDTAVAAFGIVDNAPVFSLFNLKSPLLIFIVISIFIISILASIHPLIRNVMRPPIRDIRDE